VYTLKIVVTGGAGFIGSHLTAKLLSLNYEVSIIDNLHPYYAPERKRRQLEELVKNNDFSFHQLDLLDNEKTSAVFKLEKPDCVFHLAALPGVPNSLIQPLEYVDYDIKATINVLKAAGESGVQHVLFASSSSVYGNQGNVPLKEDMATGNVVSPYAAAKYGAESFCHAYANLFGYKLTIFRYFTVYGPWGRPDMAISKFIRKLLNNEEIVVYGKGTARDYTFIDDIVSGMIAALHRAEGNEVFNLGAGHPVTMEELLRYLSEYFPQMKIRHASERAGDVKATWANITKAKEKLGYEPKVSIKDGLERTIEWARDYET
jgi:UDP-glucuronate 4-epimerase